MQILIMGVSIPNLIPEISYPLPMGDCIVWNAACDHTSVSAKWHLIPTNGLSRVHKCDIHTYRHDRITYRQTYRRTTLWDHLSQQTALSLSVMLPNKYLHLPSDQAARPCDSYEYVCNTLTSPACSENNYSNTKCYVTTIKAEILSWDIQIRGLQVKCFCYSTWPVAKRVLPNPTRTRGLITRPNPNLRYGSGWVNLRVRVYPQTCIKWVYHTRTRYPSSRPEPYPWINYPPDPNTQVQVGLGKPAGTGCTRRPLIQMCFICCTIIGWKLKPC